jgi:hypothetical protein
VIYPRTYERVGDLGCSGIDVEKWRAENRAPLYPGKMNRWLLVRTLRDKPDPKDIELTLLAVFNKWFEGSPLDPALTTKEGGRAGPVDNIHIVRSSRSPLSLREVSYRREQLATLPTVNGTGGLIYLEVHFACRVLAESMPWPVRTAPGIVGVQLTSSAECPLNADWMLSEVGAPLEDAPPEVPILNVLENKTGEVLKGASEFVVNAAQNVLSPLFWPLVATLAGFGVYLWVRTKR